MIRTIATRGGEMLRLEARGDDGPREPVIPRPGLLHATFARFTAFQQIVRRLSVGPDVHRFARLVDHKPKTAALPLLLLAGCLGNDAPPPVSTIPTTAAACEALRPGFPITYSGKGDTAETVRQVRAVNARFAAACS